MSATDHHSQGSPSLAPHDDIEKKLPNMSETTDTESALPAPAAPGFEPAPDGGARAWLVVAGSAAVLFSCLGFMNTFGVFEQYYLTHQLRDEAPSNVAWIGSLMAFIQFAGGVFTGPLFDRYGVWVIRPGAVVYIFALMMTSICKEYWQFMLAQGVLAGIGMSMLQVPSFAAVSQYFDKKRAAALGLVVSGSSLGGVVFPIALSKMLNGSSLGFGWSVRIMAFVVTPLLAFACFAISPRVPPRKTSFFLASAFKNTTFLMLIASAFCSFIGMYMPIFYLPTYAVSRGMDTTLSSYLVAIMNAASTFGRIIPGIIADRFGKLNVFAFGGIATGVTVLCLNSATSTPGLIVYSLGFGFCSGTIISAASAALTVCTTDFRNLGTYLGMGMALSSLATLVGPPVDGVMVTHYDAFTQACIFSGVMGLAGGVLAFLTKATTPKGLWGRM